MGKTFKVGLALIASVALYGCGGFERISSPTQAEAPSIVNSYDETAVAAAIAGFEASFYVKAGFAIKNTGTAKRWAYAYYTSFDNQTLPLGSQTLLVNPGATWTSSFNKTCVQLDLSTGGVGGRPDIGFAYYDKYGVRMTSANYAAKVAECRALPRPTPTPTPQCIADRSNPSWNCQECDGNICLVPRDPF